LLVDDDQEQLLLPAPPRPALSANQKGGKRVLVLRMVQPAIAAARTRWHRMPG